MHHIPTTYFESLFSLYFKILLASGADYKKKYNSAMYNQFSPVHICASKSKTACIEVLWKYGASLNVKNGDGLLPKELTPDDACKELILRLEGILFILLII